MGPSALPPGEFAWTLNGRNAIFLGLHALSIPKGGAVLVPAFHCTAVVDPILAYGARVIYYPVGRDFSVDLADLGRRIDSAPAAALLCIHYFGFPAPVEAMSALCIEKGIPLLEDCCHALFGSIGDRALGGFGDAAFFSFRKTLVAQDGGALVIGRAAARAPIPASTPWVYEARMAKWTLESLLKRGDDDFSRDGEGAAPPADAAPASAGGFDMRKGPVTHDDPAFMEPLAKWPMSLVSRWILSRCDAASIVRARRRNYLGLESRLSGVTGMELCFPSLAGGVCPMAFPFLARSASRLDYRLRKAGLPAFSFGETLSPTLDMESFPDAAHLSRNLTLLPVHQGLGDTELDRLAATVKAVLAEER